METNNLILMLHVVSIALWGGVLGFSYNKRTYLSLPLRYLLYGLTMYVIALLIKDLQRFEFYVQSNQSWLIGNIGFPIILWLLIRHIEDLKDGN
ncbi:MULTISPECIES: hypothetical protein [unclassified Chryseobacterium]|uniref:hypothetical protein n=1 Tax=unclassified Chryseobacterium TaxID=2593645 RepID=UPI000D372C81|nr:MULTISPECIES: hypothetical protein [unclassified Chryseobacterium]PTT76229.1 hypothetical protein DBR25_06565 [Chryseobacterium sp. HMWF001]PVV49366.1 hypothetical protein DD829_22935 [Chryseobacterium sp. HMWF035]